MHDRSNHAKLENPASKHRQTQPNKTHQITSKPAHKTKAKYFRPVTQGLSPARTDQNRNDRAHKQSKQERLNETKPI